MLMYDAPILAMALPVSPHEIVFAVLLPAAISLFAMLIAWRPWSSTANGHWAGGVAIGAGFSIGLLGLQAMPPLPPISAQDWLFYLGILAALLGLIDSLFRLPLIVRYLLAVVACVASAYLVIKVQHSWEARENVTWIVTAAAAMFAGYVMLDRASDKLQNNLVPTLMTLAAAGLGLFMMFSGSQTFGQRAGIIAATTAVIVPIAWWSKRLSLARGGVLAFVMLFGGLLVTCYYYPDKIVPYRLVLIAAAPVIGLIPAMTKLKGLKRWTACVLLAVIFIGAAVGPAAVQFVRDYDAPKDEYSE